MEANSIKRSQRWFQFWVTESCSIRLLCKLSGHSASKLSGIKNYWLERMPPGEFDYTDVKYMIFDATYFHKDGCLLNVMDATNQKIIAHLYVRKESFAEAYPWFVNLKRQGLSPRFIITDGERSILRAMRLVWPQAKFQRCLYHLQHEGMRWLRTYPKTEAGRALRDILSRLSWIKTGDERDSFLRDYSCWLDRYKDYVLSLPRTAVASKDLRRTMVLLTNALPDMFHYLQDSHIQSTTNALEGFHSRLKADYRRHRGLTKNHRIQYIHWYCYFNNKLISNTI